MPAAANRCAAATNCSSRCLRNNTRCQATGATTKTVAATEAPIVVR
ncbi:Uncharacterised protein [Mycobacteroides abscessus subsp. abscessus]|nr:Uncharacterised protein [Mycobacteroides abscessus subsp. abscessus]